MRRERPARPHVRRLAWATDIHLNFVSREGVSTFCKKIAHEGADALVLTGDIAEAPSVQPLLEAVAGALEIPIYFVLGNHDYYRSSIARVRAQVTALTERSPWLAWLPAAGVIEIGPGIALVGVDGWSDARLGDWERSRVMLNDYLLVADLTGIPHAARRKRLNELGDAEAETLRELLQSALTSYKKVLVATHVPPFKEACWHEGKISSDDWLPHFTCRATGEVLRRAALDHPNQKIRVLCGHSHSAGSAEILPNLRVVTGAAEYGEPAVQGTFDLCG